MPCHSPQNQDFKTPQYQSQTTKRQAGASATWKVPGDTRVTPGPISSPVGHLWKTLGLQVSVCTLIDAWGSVSNGKEDGVQLPAVTDKMPSASVMAESTLSSFSGSPKDVMCHNPQL